MGQTQMAKEAVDEISDQTQKSECVEDEFGEDKLGIAEWKAHGDSALLLLLPVILVLFLLFLL